MEKTLQEKQLAFLEETVAFYSINPRCVILGEGGMETCRYFADGLSGCAIGRHVKDKQICMDWDESALTVSSIFQDLPISLNELGRGFLQNIQDLHDNNDYWDEETNGLSQEGINKVKSIKQEHYL